MATLLPQPLSQSDRTFNVAVGAQIKGSTRPREIKSKRGILHYVIDVKSAADVQAGAATFRGTRILVHHVADLISQGATEAELLEDYPRLTRKMIAAAAIYVKSHPRRGRPRKPSWRNNRPLSVLTIESHDA